MKKILRKLIYNKFLARLLMKPLLYFYSRIYFLVGIYARQLEGIHPKHRIIRYKEWFYDKIESGNVCLDVGCNIGLMTELVSSKASFVYGIDIDPKMIDEASARKQNNNIKYICADVTTFDFSECQSIDCIILSNILEHIKDRVSFLRILVSRIRWHDSNHKRLLFRVPMIDRDWITLYRKEWGVDYRLDKTHCIEYTLDTFREELMQAGLTIIEYKIKFGEIYAVAETR